jgi:hypothetical protein
MSALAFLNLKSFHPTNKNNQRRLWIAKEKAKEKLAREEDARKELEEEQDYINQKMLTITGNQREEQVKNLESQRQRKQQLLGQHDSSSSSSNMILETTEETDGKTKRKRRKRGGNKNNNTSAEETIDVQTAINEQVELERGKRTLGFMYAVPPGLKQAMEEQEKEEVRQKKIQEATVKKQKEIQQIKQQLGEKFSDKTFYPKPLMVNSLTNDNNTMQEASAEEVDNTTESSSHTSSDRDHLDEYMPKHMVPDHEKFPILKNAPVQGSYAQNVKIRHKPFGIELRDVRCTKCGGYGHTNVDRECPMRDYNPLDIQRQKLQDPMTLIQQREKEMGIYEEEEDKPKEDNIDTILSNLSKKERKAVEKKIKQLKKEKKRAKKEEKKKRKRHHDSPDEERSRKKHRHDSSSDEEDNHRSRKSHRHDSSDEESEHHKSHKDRSRDKGDRSRDEDYERRDHRDSHRSSSDRYRDERPNDSYRSDRYDRRDYRSDRYDRNDRRYDESRNNYR